MKRKNTVFIAVSALCLHLLVTASAEPQELKAVKTINGVLCEQGEIDDTCDTVIASITQAFDGLPSPVTYSLYLALVEDKQPDAVYETSYKDEHDNPALIASFDGFLTPNLEPLEKDDQKEKEDRMITAIKTFTQK